jgi:cell division protein ZipA
MDTATLRWIIIGIGLVILAAIFLFGNPERKQKPSASRRKAVTEPGRREPILADDADPFPPAEPLELQGQGELPIDSGPVHFSENQRAAEPVAGAGRFTDQGAGQTTGAPGPRPGGRIEPELKAVPKPPPRPRKPAGPPPEKIVTLFILAGEAQPITGTGLLQAALKTGMELGDMDIFHRQADGSDTPIFSMANAVKPGYFDKDSWNTFETKALVIFMTLPGPMLALDAWDSMLATARRIADVLNAELNGEDHQPLTRQKEGKVREEMRQFDRERARKALL